MLDPATLEIIRQSLRRVTEEMKVTIKRTSPSPLTYEMQDFSVAVLNDKAELLAQAAGLPHFLGNLGASVRAVAKDIGGFSEYNEGDVYITNDPYQTTIHLADVTVFSPIFHRKNLVGFAMSRVHWIDIGSARTVGGVFTEIFQEGTFFKSTKVCNDWQVDENILRLIGANSRLPDSILGDLRAQISACKIGSRRYKEIIEKYGSEIFDASVHQMLDQAEEMALAEVAKLPEGKYRASGNMDNDGINVRKPIPIIVEVTIKDRKMVVNLTGSSGPVEGNCNSGFEQTKTACRTAFMGLVAPSYLANEGFFRPLSVIVPEDSIFNAKWPVATTFSWMPLEYVMDLVHTAVSRVLPDRAVAASYGCSSICHIHGYDAKNKKYWVLSDTEGGGWGGFMEDDGESAMKFGDVTNPPAEFVEAKYSVRVERYELIADSGGPGRTRGGLGLLRDYRILADKAFLHVVYERNKNRPWGILGGLPGGPNTVIVNPGTKRQKVSPKTTALPLFKGDLVRLITGGGGGYGKPSQREKAKVISDLVNGYVSKRDAAKYYGVRESEAQIRDRAREASLKKASR